MRNKEKERRENTEQNKCLQRDKTLIKVGKQTKYQRDRNLRSMTRYIKIQNTQTPNLC